MKWLSFIQNFLQGNEFEAFEVLGGHLHFGGKAVFRTYAPHASRVALICEASNWQEIPMERIRISERISKKDLDSILNYASIDEMNGIFACEIPEGWEGMMYKYRIYDKHGKCVDHCDPYGYFMEKRPQSASKLWKLPSSKSFLKRANKSYEDISRQALNIYEVHAGSFAKNGWDFLSYGELARKLIPYLKKNNYNAVEFLPLQEHPMDASWGYQGSCAYAVTSRFGSPKEWYNFIRKCHKNGIKVIIDFVSVHFAVDPYGIREYDGTKLFEHHNLGPWGSLMYNHDQAMVRSFLKSAAWFWAKKYDIDGIRFDAVSNLIYWQGKSDHWYFGGARFLGEITKGLKELDPGLILIAEDSSNCENMTKSHDEGGFGFDYKWAMGWRYDVFDYMKREAGKRAEIYHKLVFSMDYFYKERFILALSHDEAGGDQGAFLTGLMAGRNESERYANARLFLMFMYAHPGKKMIFMGNEMGFDDKWKNDHTLRWDDLKKVKHKSFQRYARDINGVYKSHPALYANDYDQSGFWWIEKNRPSDGIVAFGRNGWVCEDSKRDYWRHDQILAFLNFSDRWQSISYDCQEEEYHLLMDSKWKIYDKKGDSNSDLNTISSRVQIWLAPFSGRLYGK